jgi:hypothetical protein
MPLNPRIPSAHADGTGPTAPGRRMRCKTLFTAAYATRRWQRCPAGSCDRTERRLSCATRQVRVVGGAYGAYSRLGANSGCARASEPRTAAAVVPPRFPWQRCASLAVACAAALQHVGTFAATRPRGGRAWTRAMASRYVGAAADFVCLFVPVAFCFAALRSSMGLPFILRAQHDVLRIVPRPEPRQDACGVRKPAAARRMGLEYLGLGQSWRT